MSWSQRASLGPVRAGAAAALAVGFTTTLLPLTAAPAAAACPSRPAPGVRSVPALPWAQQRFGADRLARLADGGGVTVAVIDSGVDAGTPQLRGRVTTGADFLRSGDGNGTGQEDCVGHGTAVASIIAARPTRTTALRGLAPEVTILPIRLSEQQDTGGTVTGEQPQDPAACAHAIEYAVDHNAQVINLSLVLGGDNPAVRAAVADAVAKGVVVVAAAGNNEQNGDPTPYPAAYPGVIGVGAIDPTGTRSAASQVGPWVDIVAPGSAITVAQPDGTYRTDFAGTSAATPFVAATAALVIGYHRGLSGRQVTDRILATADPAPGGPAEYGRGVVDPYRALTDTVSVDRPRPAAALPPPADRTRARQAAAAAARARTVALVLAGVVAGAALLVVLVAGVVPRGRARGWRPGTGVG